MMCLSAMKRILLASALVLASVSLSPALAESLGTELKNGAHLSERAAIVVSEAQIARFKTALKLTPAQEQLWAPIEGEFRQITRTSQRSEPEGIVQRIRNRFRAIVIDVAALRRLGDVARPLLMSLDDEQKQRALQVVRTMGMSSLASVF
jgi:hypothetical protein